jgi:hypothetical protein
LLLYVVCPGIFDPVLLRFQTIEEDKGSERLGIWSAAFKVVAESPIIGVGVDNCATAIGRYYPTAYMAHSIYIGALVELGIIGVGLMLWWFASLSFKSWRAADRLWVFPLLVVYLAEGAFLHEFYFECFWLALGLAEGALAAQGGSWREEPRAPQRGQARPSGRLAMRMRHALGASVLRAGPRLARNSVRGFTGQYARPRV